MARSEGANEATIASQTESVASGTERAPGPIREELANEAAAAAAKTKVARHNIRFDATSEISYHALMEGALDKWHRVIMAAIIISGTASFAAVGSMLPVHLAWMGQVAAFVVVAASTLDFVFDLPGAARLHRDLRGRLRDVLSTLETCEDPALPQLRAKMQEIYAQEPANLRFVQTLGYNTAVDAIYPRDKAPAHYEPVPRRPFFSPLGWMMRVDPSWRSGHPSPTTGGF
jgi:hypothetical protein